MSAGTRHARQPLCGEVRHRRKPAVHHQDSLEGEENLVSCAAEGPPEPTVPSLRFLLCLFVCFLPAPLSYSAIQGKIRSRSTITSWRFAAFSSSLFHLSCRFERNEFSVLSGDLRRTVPAARAAAHRRHVHHAADRALQAAAGVAAPSCILDFISIYSFLMMQFREKKNKLVFKSFKFQTSYRLASS